MSEISIALSSKFLEKLKHLEENVHVYFQTLIEKYYLQPVEEYSVFSSYTPSKWNLKDGKIERLVHGGMHAVRVALYIDFFHKIHKKHNPERVQKIFSEFEKIFKHQESQIILLTQFAGLLHDAGRKGEGTDVWEKESAEIFRSFIETTTVNPVLADILKFAILFKDKPAEFRDSILKISETLNEPSLKAEEFLSACAYLRMLIHEGDCADILRCVGKFQANNLESLKGAKKEMQEDILEFIKNCHTLLYQQGDLLFCAKIYLGTEELQTHFHGSRHLLKEKVKIEHANNAYMAMLKSVCEMPYFRQFFQGKDLKLNIRVESPEAEFVPFIHGTNSSVFVLLPKTQFKFVSPITMMQKFGIAPLSGEISLGGLDKPESDGRMCFGRLDTRSVSKHHDPYTCSKIWFRYSAVEFTKPSLKELPRNTERLIAGNFNSINEFMIMITRARMWGLDVYKNNPMLREISFHFNKMRQYFYLVLCVMKHIEVNPGYSGHALKMRYPQDHLMYYFFTDERVHKLISESKLDFENLFKNPNPDNIKRLIDCLRIPESAVREHCSDDIQLNIALNSELFLPAQIELKEKKENQSFEIENLPSSKFNHLLEIAGIKGSDTLRKHIPFLLNRLCLLEKRFKILLSILQCDSRVIELSDFEKYCVENSFPLMFTAEHENNIELFDFSSREYRARCDLTLGKEITGIAVKSEREKLLVESFLEQHKISNVAVTLLNDLRIGERPTVPANALKPVLSHHLPKKPAELVYMYLSNYPQTKKLTFNDVYLQDVCLKKSLNRHRIDISWQNELNYYLAAKQLKHQGHQSKPNYKQIEAGIHQPS